MTRAEAIAEQNRISEHFNLGWWYGTNCEKCCGVLPKFMTNGGTSDGRCFYRCDVCGKRTKQYQMPWMAEKAWNNHEYLSNAVQMNLFNVEVAT